MKTLSYNQKGFGLVGSLVMAAIGVATVLTIAMMMGNVFKAQRGVKARDASRELLASLRQLLKDPVICTASFANIGNPKLAGFVVNRIRDNAGNIKFQTNTPYMNRLFVISSLRIRNYVRDVPANPNVGKSELVIGIRKIGSVAGAVDVSETFLVQTSLNAAGNRITQCYSLSAADSLWSPSAANMANIFYSGGKVGIGTTTPQNLLEVKGAGAEAAIRVTRNNKALLIDPNENSANIRSQIAADSGMGLLFSVNGTGVGRRDAMMIDSSGKVGIGTNAPKVKLDVNGGVRPGESAVVLPCNAANEGTIRYAAGNGVAFTKMQFCQRKAGAVFGWVEVGSVNSISGDPNWNACRIVTGGNFQVISCNANEIMVSVSNTFTGVQGCVITDTNSSATTSCGDHYYAYDWHSTSAISTIKCCVKNP